VGIPLGTLGRTGCPRGWASIGVMLSLAFTMLCAGRSRRSVRGTANPDHAVRGTGGPPPPLTAALAFALLPPDAALGAHCRKRCCCQGLPFGGRCCCSAVLGRTAPALVAGWLVLGVAVLSKGQSSPPLGCCSDRDLCLGLRLRQGALWPCGDG